MQKREERKKREPTLGPKKKFRDSLSVQRRSEGEIRSGTVACTFIWACGFAGLEAGLEAEKVSTRERMAGKAKQEEMEARMHFRDISPRRTNDMQHSMPCPNASISSKRLCLYVFDLFVVRWLVSGQEIRIGLDFAHNILEPVVESLDGQITRVCCLCSSCKHVHRRSWSACWHKNGGSGWQD